MSSAPTPVVEPPRLRRIRGDSTLALVVQALPLVSVALGGLALRLWVYHSATGVLSGDEAVVGLMARHVLHGQLTVFYWGQAYGGPQEALLAAPLFWVFGSSVAALRVGPLVLSALAAVLVWRVGRRTIGDRRAVVAGALFWVWPPFTVFLSGLALGIYATGVLYCPLILLCALRAVERPNARRALVLGLCTGLAFWQTTQIVPVLLAAVAWTIWKAPAILRRAVWAIGGFLVGALPWLVWNLQHGSASLTEHGRSDAATYAHALRLLVSPLLPMLLGLRTPLTAELIAPRVVVYAVYAGLIAAFCVGAFRSRHRDLSLLFACAAAFPFIWAISSRVASLTGSPQFLVVVSPVVALLVAQLGTDRYRAIVLVALAGAVSVVTIHRIEAWYTAYRPQDMPLTPRDFRPLVRTLDRLGVDRVYADYAIAYPLDFESRERIVAVENSGTGVTFANGVPVPTGAHVRYRTYEDTVAASTRPGFVYFRQNVEQATIVPQLVAHGYRRVVVGPFVVLAPPA